MSTANDRLRKQAKKVIKDLHKMRGSAKDAAQEKLRQVGANGSLRYEQGRGKVHQAERAVEHFIQKHTLKSVLIAAGVGIVFGGIWYRRFLRTAPAGAKSAA